MKHIKKIKRVKREWSRIKPVDQYLIVIMIILLFYSVFTLILGNAGPEIMGNIDTVVRTAIASIFGYFISSNFIRNENAIDDIDPPDIKNIRKPAAMESPPSDGSIKSGKIGFEYEAGNKADLDTQTRNTGLLRRDKAVEQYIAVQSSRLQVRVIGWLCIISILFLLSVRFLGAADPDGIATLLQFRDIICASIGFLIGMPTDQHKDSSG